MGTDDGSARAVPAVGKRAVADIRPPEIIGALRPIWEVTPETARRTLDRVRAVFTWAIVNEVRERGNPCEGVAKLLISKRKSPGHFRAMPYAELPASARVAAHALLYVGGPLSHQLGAILEIGGASVSLFSLVSHRMR